MTKFYFTEEDGECCYTLDYHLSNAKDEGLKEIELYEAIPYTDSEMFWCKASEEVTEQGYCGKDCQDYEPKNGKSGMCRHKGKLHIAGEKKTFKVKS